MGPPGSRTVDFHGIRSILLAEFPRSIASKKKVAMPTSQNFLNNLENLRLVTTLALEQFQNNRDDFARCATGGQVRQAEKAICQVRVLTVQLEREFTILEYLTSDAPTIPALPNN